MPERRRSRRAAAWFLAVIFSVLLLSGCAAKDPLPGLYAPEGGVPGADAPYLILQGDRFTVVQQVAVSYQPSGLTRREGDRLILEGNYANEPFRLVFRIRNEKTLDLLKNESQMPAGPNADMYGSRWTLWEQE